MNDFDLVVVGAGIVGLTSARELALKFPNLRIAVVEKESGPAAHQTGHNSGVIHSGIYYVPGSLKARLCRRGIELLKQFCDEKKIPYEICGKLIAAVDQSELARLDALYQRGLENGLKGLKVLSADEAAEIEPELVCLRALWVPETGIVSYRRVCEELVLELKGLGVEIFWQTKLCGLMRENALTILDCQVDRSQSLRLKTRFTLNCAGLHSDTVALHWLPKCDVRIVPFRGEYYYLNEAGGRRVRGLIYPVPNPDLPFLGVHLTRTIDGIKEAGPNAVLALAKEGYSWQRIRPIEILGYLTWPGFWQMVAKFWRTGLFEMYRSFSKRAFLKSLQNLIPSLQESELADGTSGVRAQAVGRYGQLVQDFAIEKTGDSLHILNAPSPAATASFAIAEYIAEYIADSMAECVANRAAERMAGPDNRPQP